MEAGRDESEAEARRRIRFAVDAYERAVDLEADNRAALALSERARGDRYHELREELKRAGYHQVVSTDPRVGLLVGTKVWWVERHDDVRSVSLDVDPREADR